MRCNKHYTDLTSIVGVCACCLRERLLLVIAAEEQAQVELNLDGNNRNSERNPVISRSVLHNRKRNQFDGAATWSDNLRPRHRHSVSDQFVYRTPEIGAPVSGVDSSKKRSFIRFLSFQYIFRSRNRKSVESVTDIVIDNATSTPSWFSSVVRGARRRRRKQPVHVDEFPVTAAGDPVRRQYCRDRGMSPVRNSDSGDVDEDESSNATASWRNTPRRTPARHGGGGGGGHRRNLSGLKFCLSPLVRASPNRQWNQNGLAPDGVLSGEIRAPVKAHLSSTKGYCANRSRKIADFGRPNQNR